MIVAPNKFPDTKSSVICPENGWLAPNGPGRVWLALLPPVAALVLQGMFWSYFQPFAWLLFYPAVFFSSWIGGVRGGLIATFVATALVTFFFIPPMWSFALAEAKAIASIVMFVGMGVLFSLFHGRLRRVTQATAEALAAAGFANDRLESRVRERTAELERSNQTLREREELFSDAFRLSPDCVVITRAADRRVIIANEALGRLWGGTPEEIIGKSAGDYTTWLTEAERATVMQTIRDHGECLNYETSLRMRDGRWVPFNLSARMIALNGEACVLAVIRDLTERRIAETAAVTVAAMVESSDDAIVGKDPRGVITSWNSGAQKIFGYTAAEMVGTPLTRLIPPDRLAEEEFILGQVARGESVRHFETVRVRKDGTRVDVSVTVSPIKDASGRVLGASKIARDITEQKRTEQALRRAREQFAAIAASSPAVLCSMRTRSEGTRYFDYAAPGIEGICGFRAEELREGLDGFIDRIHPSDRAGLRAALDESARALGPLRYAFRVQHPEKGERWVEGNSLATREADGGVVWHGVMMDITEQKRATEAWRLSEERLRLAVDAARLGTWERSFLTNRLVWSEAQEAMMGFARGAFPGTLDAFLELVHPDDRPVLAAAQQKALVDDGRYQAELRFKLANGRVRWGYLRGQILFGAEGKPERMLGIELDITERKAAEEALRESEGRYRSLVDNIPAGVFRKDAAGRFVFVSARFCAIQGISAEILLGRTATEVAEHNAKVQGAVTPDVQQSFERASRGADHHRSIMQTGRPIEADEAWIAEDGSRRFFQTVKTPVCGADGAVVGSQGVLFEITERKRVEAALRESNERFASMFHSSPVATTVSTVKDGRYLNVNEAFLRMFDRAREEVVGHTVFELNTWVDLAQRDALFAVLRVHGEVRNFEMALRAKSGRVLQLLWSGVKIVIDGQDCLLGSALDITERKRVEDALRESTAKLQAAMASMTDALFVSDAAGRLADCNDAFASFHKFKNKDECARSLAESPALLEVFMANGEPAPLEQLPVARALSGQTATNVEYALRRNDTGESWVGSYSFAPIRDDQGAVVGSVVVGRDITEKRQIEEALRASEDQFRTIFEVASIGMAQADPSTGKLIRVNQKMSVITGYAADELIGKRFSEITHADDRQADWAEFQRVVRGEASEYQLEKRYVRKNGEIIWVNVNVTVIRNAAGKPERSMAAVQDIDERKRAEEALRLHKAILEETGKIAKVGGWSFDAVTGVGFWTDEVARIHDLDPGLGPSRDSGLAYYTPESRPKIEAALKRAVEQGTAYDLELEIVSAKGIHKWIRTIGHPLMEEGRVVRVHGSFQDITERKDVERALWEKEQLLHATDRRLAEIVQGMTEACFALDREWRFTFVNDRGQALLRHRREEMVGRPIWEVFHQLVGTPMERRYRQAMAERVPVSFEVFSPVALRWLDIRLFPTGEGLAAFLLDISERKRGEEERDKLTLLVEKSRDFIAIRDLAGTVTFINAGARTMIGLPPDRAPGTLSVADFEPESWLSFVRDTVTPVVREKGTWEGEMQLRHLQTGALIDVMSSIMLVRDPAGQPVGLATVARDITEEKRANEKLAAERTLLRTLFDLLPDYIYVKDRDHRILACNDRCAARFGVESTAALIGKTDADLFPEEVAGRFRDEEIGVLQGGTVVDREESYVLPSGVREILLTTKMPLRDGAGNIIGIIGCGHDITKRKENEEAIRRLNAELERRVVERTVQLEEANRELEAFSYSVSHDLRAPLRAVDGFSQAVMEDFGALLPKDGQRQLQTIRTSAQRMGELIDDLLAFSRLSRQPLNKQPVEMVRLVRSVLADLADETTGREIEILVGDLPVCDGDPRLLRQVWMNLLSNALKYTRRRARAVVEVGWSDAGGERIYFVRDNGNGFDMRYAGKLFTVFQRLHRAEDYEGTGVGLAIVQRVVNRHGGRVWAEAAVDQGATFHFTLEEKAPL